MKAESKLLLLSLIGTAAFAWWYLRRPKPAINIATGAAPRKSAVVMPSVPYLAGVDLSALPYQGTWSSTGPIDLANYDKQIYD